MITTTKQKLDISRHSCDTTHINVEIKKGFTLVELIVSMALFTIVVFITTSAFFNITQLYKKASATRAAMDTLSIAMESMARNIRIGDTYHCITGSEYLNMYPHYPSRNPPLSGPYYSKLTAQDCSSGSDGILFYVPDNSTEGVMLMGYALSSPPLYIILGRGAGTCCSWVTETNLHISNLKFYVTGAAGAGASQPRVNIMVQGYALSDPDKTKFSVYTSVTQRSPK